MNHVSSWMSPHCLPYTSAFNNPHQLEALCIHYSVSHLHSFIQTVIPFPTSLLCLVNFCSTGISFPSPPPPRPRAPIIAYANHSHCTNDVISSLFHWPEPNHMAINSCRRGHRNCSENLNFEPEAWGCLCREQMLHSKW